MAISTTDIQSTDTWEQGRVKANANDQAVAAGANAIQAQQTTHLSQGHPGLYYPRTDIDTQQSNQDAALETHKSSGDHDARYLSASYLASLVRTAFNQTIDGLKAFLQKIAVRNATPTVELQDADGNIMGRIYSTKSGAPAKNILRLSIAEAAAWKEVLEAVESGVAVNFPNHDVQSKGNKLATEAYVETYVQENPPAASSSVFVFERSIWIDPLTYSGLPFSLVLMQPTLVPAGAVLSETRYGSISDDNVVDARASQSAVHFSDTGYNMVKAEFSIDTHNGASLSIFAAHCVVNGSSGEPVTWTAVQNFTLTETSVYIASGTTVGMSVTLKFGMAV